MFILRVMKNKKERIFKSEWIEIAIKRKSIEINNDGLRKNTFFSDCIFNKSLRYTVLDLIRGFFLILNPRAEFLFSINPLKQHIFFNVCTICNYDKKTFSFHHNLKGILDLSKTRNTGLLYLHFSHILYNNVAFTRTDQMNLLL